VTSTITPLGVALTVFMGLLLLFLPRRYALLPVLLAMCYVPIGQAVMVSGVHLYFLRILMILGWVRMAVRGELQWQGLTEVDHAFLAWIASAIVLGSFLWMDTQALINRFAYACDATGAYFLFRALLRDKEDIFRVFKMLALLVPLLAISMIAEKLTGRNSFSILGGVAELSAVREGVIRSQATFGHSILAGLFGAAVMPFFVALWRRGRSSRWLGLTGLVSAAVITGTAGSSGPLGAFAAAIVGLCMWRFRAHMRTVRWGVVAMLVGLQLVMKVPVWWAISHISVFSGNTAWYRSNIIDKFIMNFGQWWLFGIRSTSSWGFLVGTGRFEGADITNMYVRVGVDGGLLTLILFITVLVRCFRGVGVSLRRACAAGESRRIQFGIWALGAALLADAIGFFDVSYFDQSFTNLCLLFAMISCATKLFLTVPQLAAVSEDPLNTGTEPQAAHLPELCMEKPETAWWTPQLGSQAQSRR
jgi:hypothetical protein